MKSMRRFILGLLPVLLLAAPAGAAVMNITTDASWEVSGDNGATWTAATVHSAFGPYAGIWDSSPDFSAETLLFKRTFVAPGNLISAFAEAGADDDLLSFKLNGNFIFGESSGGADVLLSSTVPIAYFVPGINTIIAEAKNIFCCHSTFAGVLSIEYNPVPVPAALPLFASALGAFGWFGLRRRKTQTA